MSTSTKKLIVLLLVPLSTAEGCVRELKSLKPTSPEKVIFGNSASDSTQQQQPFKRSSLENVPPNKRGKPAITAKAAETPTSVAIPTGTATDVDTQKQTGQLPSGTTIHKGENPKVNVDDADKDHNRNKQLTGTPEKEASEKKKRFWKIALEEGKRKTPKVQDNQPKNFFSKIVHRFRTAL